MTKTEEKIIEFKKQIKQIIEQDISTTNKIENLWQFYVRNAENIPAFKHFAMRNKLKRRFYKDFLELEYDNDLDYPHITDSMYMELLVVIQRNELWITGAMRVLTRDDLIALIFQALLQHVQEKEVKDQVLSVFNNKQ